MRGLDTTGDSGGNGMGRVEGKVAFITGAARGQGRSHALRLAEEGADIIGVDLCAPVPHVEYPMPTDADLKETARLVESLDRRCVTAQLDVRDGAALREAVQAGITEFGRLDIVCVNAGVSAFGQLIDISDEEWDTIVSINLTGAWQTIRAAAPAMIEAGNGGSIIITSSTGGTLGVPHTGHYDAAKHGVVGLMRCAANELAQHSIRVNTIHPTAVGTPLLLNERLFRLFLPEHENPGRDDFEPLMQQMNLLPVAWLDPRDVSNAVLFLASDEARYVTGTTLHVDAGFTQKVG
jgi:SDR family mycofactocin-dependent oxidoreductase